MASEKWSALGSQTSVLTTELNSLATVTYCAAGAAFDNSAGPCWGRLELNVTYGSAPAAGGFVTIFLIPSADGTNYGDGGGSVVPGQELILWQFSIRAVTTAQKVVSLDLPIPAGKFKVVAYNGGSTAMPSSGSTVKLCTYSRDVA